MMCSRAISLCQSVRVSLVSVELQGRAAPVLTVCFTAHRPPPPSLLTCNGVFSLACAMSHIPAAARHHKIRADICEYTSGHKELSPAPRVHSHTEMRDASLDVSWD